MDFYTASSISKTRVHQKMIIVLFWLRILVVLQLLHYFTLITFMITSGVSLVCLDTSVCVCLCMCVCLCYIIPVSDQTGKHTDTQTHTHTHTHTFLGHTYFSWIEFYWAISNTWTAQTHTHTHKKKNKNHCQLLLAAVACGTMCWSWMMVCCDNVSLYILPEFNHKPSITYQHSHTPAGHTSITHAYSGTQTVRGERKGKGAEGEKECANR